MANAQPTIPKLNEKDSWDVRSGWKKMENDYEKFDTRHAKEAYLVYADGDVPKDKASRVSFLPILKLIERSLSLSQITKFYHYLLNVSIITRWFLFIVPLLAILWIPGILAVTLFPNAKVILSSLVRVHPSSHFIII